MLCNELRGGKSGVGVDIMIGGAGNDVYIVDSIDDIIVERLGRGTDMVQSLISYTLDKNLENLTLKGVANINGTGNDSNNTITGNDKDNTLFGGGLVKG